MVELLAVLDSYDIPKRDIPNIDPAWSAALSLGSVELLDEPEALTSNWLRIEALPDQLLYLGPDRFSDFKNVEKGMRGFDYPYIPHREGFLTFSSLAEVSTHIGKRAKLVTLGQEQTSESIGKGGTSLGVEVRDASNILVNLVRQAWEKACRDAGLRKYSFSCADAFHANDDTIQLGRRVSWGKQGERRSSALRNKTKRGIWEYGFSAKPSLHPFPHLRLKGRVIWSDVDDSGKATVISDHVKQHRLRRSGCASWRNKAWYGRMMALLEIMAPDSAYIALPFGEGIMGWAEAMPIKATAHKTTPSREIPPMTVEFKSEDQHV